MKNNTRYALTALLSISLLASCSRPQAFVQRSTRESFARTEQVAANTVSEINPPATSAVELSAPAEQPAAQLETVSQQLEASARDNSALTADRSVQKRLARVRTMLAAASTKAASAEVVSAPAKKPNLAERLMLNKINKKIGKQLAPQNPEKTMLNVGTLTTGAVLVLIGLLLMLLTTGTAATIGLVALIVGAVLLLVGLL